MLYLWFSFGFIFAMIFITMRLKRVGLYKAFLNNVTETQLNVGIAAVSLILSFLGCILFPFLLYEVYKEKEKDGN